jgi:hypothetical protein
MSVYGEYVWYVKSKSKLKGMCAEYIWQVCVMRMCNMCSWCVCDDYEGVASACMYQNMCGNLCDRYVWHEWDKSMW